MAQILGRFGAQEHDTDTTIPVSALLWNLIKNIQLSVKVHGITVCCLQCNGTRYNCVLFAV